MQRCALSTIVDNVEDDVINRENLSQFAISKVTVLKFCFQ